MRNFVLGILGGLGWVLYHFEAYPMCIGHVVLNGISTYANRKPIIITIDDRLIFGHHTPTVGPRGVSRYKMRHRDTDFQQSGSFVFVPAIFFHS